MIANEWLRFCDHYVNYPYRVATVVHLHVDQKEQIASLQHIVVLFHWSSPFFTLEAKHSRVWGNGFTPFRCESSLTVIKAVCMHVLLYPIRPYCADVCWLSSGRLEKDSYPYAWEPRSQCDLSPDEALCFLARSLRSHIAGGSEDQWAPAITSSPLHISSLISVGGPRGMRRVSLQHTGRNRDVFH